MVDVCPHLASSISKAVRKSGRKGPQDVELFDCGLSKDDVTKCDTCSKGYLNWVCLGCLEVFCGSEKTPLKHSRETGHSISLQTVTLTPRCEECNRCLTKEEVRQPQVDDVLKALHSTMHGHYRYLYPELEEQRRRELDEKVKEALNSTSEVDKKWKHLNDTFDNMMAGLVDQIRGALTGGSLESKEPELDEAEKAAVLGGDVTLEAIASGLKEGRYKNVVVVAGAGISVSAGIPDFRTPGTGLYSNLAKYKLPTPQSVFDIAFYRDNPKPFVQLAKEIYPGLFKPTYTHRFLKALDEAGCLRRVITQNIDGLEELAGVPRSKIIQAHGGFGSASCITCKSPQPVDKTRSTIMENKVPKCYCGGTVKPDIVFFGEDLPKRFHDLAFEDMRACDLLLVMGTSLAVQPVGTLHTRVPRRTPRVLFNREVVGAECAGGFDFESADNYRDISALGDCDAKVEEFASMCGIAVRGPRARASLDSAVAGGGGGGGAAA